VKRNKKEYYVERRNSAVNNNVSNNWIADYTAVKINAIEMSVVSVN
jgi:hypothetical protein